MSVPGMDQMQQKLAAILQESGTSAVDWEQRPDRAVSASDDDGHVSVALQGFAVQGVTLDAGWFGTASKEAVEQSVAEAVENALTALVDAEIDAAMSTNYETADVQTKLMQLSREASELFEPRIRDLGESAR